MKKGLTLIELMITITVFVMLAAAIVYVLRAVLLTWSSQEIRAGVDINLDRGIEEMVRDLREAKTIQSSNDEIRFQDLSSYYVYYLYNPNDAYPPSFSQAFYQLKKAALAGNITGNFTYGAGDIKIIDILPPPVSDLSFNASITTIDLSIKRRDETIRSRTQIRPRNL